MLANKALSAAPSAVPVYVEDVFSTYLYRGTGSTLSINNGVDLSTKGGLVWIKSRSGNDVYSHVLTDTARGVSRSLYSNLTNAAGYSSGYALTAFNTDGFTVYDPDNSGYGVGEPSTNYASWTFAQQAKFFDVVTYTGNGSARTISHNLGSVPGCIIIKRTDTSGYAWCVYHRALGTPASNFLFLNTTDGTQTGTVIWNNTAPTSTVFSLGNYSDVNANGGTYVAYLFAHDAGGFGASGSDSVIKCGSFTTNGSGAATIDLGWEPQWLLQKHTTAGSWWMTDNMRGFSNSGTVLLRPHLSDAEYTDGNDYMIPSATGFSVKYWSANTEFIYIAIRRGPMKTPTTGTEVFAAETGNSSSPQSSLALGASHAGDLWIMAGGRSSPTTPQWLWADRLRGLSSTTGFPILDSSDQSAEVSRTTSPYLYRSASDSRIYFTPSTGNMTYKFARAPGFFDVVCYTGNATARTISHNLGATPELMIVKNRSSSSYVWAVYNSSVGATKYLRLPSNIGAATESNIWNDTAPTSSVFTVGTGATTNESGVTYVAYLFASLSGVSKVGTYTGNGSSVTVTTNFQPRFILVKRTDSSGNWIVSDSARGLVSGSDPYLLLNDTAAEDTDEDWVDITSTSFTVNQTTAANANVNTGTYIYLAVS